jgi:beta-glucosidase
VLLKNDGVLPLKKEQKVALIGPNADISQLGNYIYYGYFNQKYQGECVAEDSLTLEQVFKQENVSFVYEKGCEFEKTDEILLERAYEAAKNSDVIVLALGDNSKGGTCCGNQDDLERMGKTRRAVTSGEGFDLNEIELTEAQQKLFEKVQKTGKPVVMILYGGRPKAITKQLDQTSGVLFAFGVGEQGNEALFDILYGKVNPSGKLPISFPRSTGHLPCFYNYKPSARGNIYQAPGTPDKPGYDYVFDTPKALFPFGYGLSYTKFTYENLQVEKLGKHSFKVSVTVRNDGDYDGDESVLLFLSQRTQRVTPVVKKLRGFKRISLKKGESKTVTFKLGKADFSFVDIDMKRRVATGQCRVLVENLQENIVVE